MNILMLEADYFASALRSQGHTVITAGFSSNLDIHVSSPRLVMSIYTRLAEQGFVPDGIIVADHGNLPCFLGLETLPCPSIFYSIDTYCNPWHIPYGHAFDTVSVAQKDYVSLFTQEKIDAHWLPLFARSKDSFCTQKDFTLRDIPVSFVGTLKHKNLPEREPFLQNFKKIHPLLIKQGAFTEIFNRSCIAINVTAASEVNFRCFEAMACGSALLMENCHNGLTDLFCVGKHILPLYPRHNAVHAASVARAALAQPQVLAQIAAQGCEEVHQKHMDTHRAKELVTLLQDCIRTQKQHKRLAELQKRRRILSTAYAVLALELTTPKMKNHADFYYKIFQKLHENI